MDSVEFNDIEFLMGNMKQEATNSSEHAGPLAEGVQNNDTDQLAMSTCMTDFILDYINRSLKNEDDEAQQDSSATDRENEDESVEALIERAENIIRENEQQRSLENIPATSAAVTNNEWMQQLNALQGSFVNNSMNLAPSTNPTSIPIYAEAARLLAGNDVCDVISVDTDSDDEVIFVNIHKSEIPVIDLSDHVSPSDDTIEPSTKRHDKRKRTHDDICYEPPAVPVEKPQFRHSCAICLDDVKSPHSTTCGHIYCGECIKNALKLFKKCPTCNKKLKVSNVHPIYL